MTRDDDVILVLFVCSDCGVRIRVDEDMRETLIDDGCVICRESVTTADFECADCGRRQ